jgi:hypothetical protein
MRGRRVRTGTGEVSCLVMPNVVDIQVDTFKQRVATILMVRVLFSAKEDKGAWTVEKFPLY